MSVPLSMAQHDRPSVLNVWKMIWTILTRESWMLVPISEIRLASRNLSGKWFWSQNYIETKTEGTAAAIFRFNLIPLTVSRHHSHSMLMN